MADLARNGAVERDIEQAITALKKGAQLLKYGRRGKPKFCPFRLSNDETHLIWYSGKEEKSLRLSSITRIVPGQRTANFQRYPRLEKEYQSFSLIYGNDRSLDLICKDKDEAEVWFVGLKALVSGGQLSRLRFDSRSECGPPSDSNSPATWSRISPASSPFGNVDNLPRQDGREAFRFQSPYGSPPRYALQQRSFSPGAPSLDSSSKLFLENASTAGSLHSDMSSEPAASVLHLRGGAAAATSAAIPLDANFRVSMSSAVSSSSQGSGQEEGDALGDVFLWGESVGSGDGGIKTDSLLPKALESAVVLDVHHIACGNRHAALVTKQGEVFCWGDESGGRLGHGVDVDVAHPKLVEALATTNTEFVACGEYHSCAVTLSGDLFTWGDGTHSYGLLGHGNDISHWTPKRVGGPLEGIRVSSVACGVWHTALVTSAGQLFTFGDGTFGVLGHGDKRSVALPKEVESLKGLKTVRVACGVWHTAAVVEVMVGYSNAGGSSGKLFTWGDGDKGRLGHGDKEQKLVPTCVAALVDYNFKQVACGHTLTVALTINGRVFTMGSSLYGQLGDVRADGKLPGLVEGRLWEAFVEEIACGAYHVAVLTAKTEVYTWGKGANGRLGHGDVMDRNTPTLVEALKEKQVKSVACGSGFTAAICLHKWVSGADQSLCSGCRQPFGFTRKRHNCYNCGHAFCHSCSARKALKASLAPNPAKPYRVCDPCFVKLKKGGEVLLPGGGGGAGVPRKSMVATQGQQGSVKKPRKLELQPEQQQQQQQQQPQYHLNQALQFSSSVQPWGAVDIPSVFNPYASGGSGSSLRPLVSALSVPTSRVASRSVSPLSRRPSPPRSATPTPTLAGLATPKTLVDELKRENDVVNHEVVKLKEQVEDLNRKLLQQDAELRRSAQQVQEALAIAGEESAKCQAAKEVIKQLTAQLKEMAERVPAGLHRHKQQQQQQFHHDQLPNGVHPPVTTLDSLSVTDDEGGYSTAHLRYSLGALTPNLRSIAPDTNGLASPAQQQQASSRRPSPEPENDWVEQDQPGVYLTLCVLPAGGRELKRVRFSRKRFSEKQAEQWWQENRQRVHEQYNIRSVDRTAPGNKL
ncbi:hypothetical protein SELMODRAFT_112120 [Selaginella moellendorffii]|uniref:FYVE-type domain-containing protein n=1 Tax=Selaginella moellendorffii TaxID=88036 RepID=D8S9K8_SELML|nr:hypothetical protein SELMODRAFT_112120 [Selaginella moellendorffii]